MAWGDERMTTSERRGVGGSGFGFGLKAGVSVVARVEVRGGVRVVLRVEVRAGVRVSVGGGLKAGPTALVRGGLKAGTKDVVRVGLNAGLKAGLKALLPREFWGDGALTVTTAACSCPLQRLQKVSRPVPFAPPLSSF